MSGASYKTTFPDLQPTPAATDAYDATPSTRSLARGAAAIAAAAAPPTRRPRKAPGKWVFPPERAPNRGGRRLPQPDWWPPPLAWATMSKRQQKRLKNVEKHEGSESAHATACVWARREAQALADDLNLTGRPRGRRL